MIFFFVFCVALFRCNKMTHISIIDCFYFYLDCMYVLHRVLSWEAYLKLAGNFLLDSYIFLGVLGAK